MKRIVILIVSLMTLCISCRTPPSEELTIPKTEIDYQEIDKVSLEAVKKAILESENERIVFQVQQCRGVQYIKLDSIMIFNNKLSYIENLKTYSGILYTTWCYKDYAYNVIRTTPIAVEVDNITANISYNEVTWQTKWNGARRALILK